MGKTDNSKDLQAGIAHVQAHQQVLSDNLELFLKHVQNGTGDVYSCLLSLRSHAAASSLVAWFVNRDLGLFKQWSYVEGKLSRILFQQQPRNWYPAYLLLAPLLSDHEPLINWFAHYELPFDESRADDISTADFHGYQALLAIRGDWDALETRCLRILDNPVAAQKKYEVDHRFYLALARGDLGGMESALDELTSPKVARVRNVEQAFGFTKKLIGTHAVIYAKIAWRHGYKVQLSSLFVPVEWLPVAPLASYEDPYDFMKNFDINMSVG